MQDIGLPLTRVLLKLGIRFGILAAITRLLVGQRIGAVMWLAWKAAVLVRLFLVDAVLWSLSVVDVPILIKCDGTARGLNQIFLTYPLIVITGLLGLSTLWL